jgi:hypothetical protein
MMLQRILLVVGLSLGVTGCVLVPVIESVSKIGITSGDREALLSRDMKKFHEALYWGDPNEAVLFASDEARSELGNQLRKSRRKERIVESRIESVAFKDDSYTAHVQVIVKYYETPFYIVNERVEDQQWQFNVPAGWRLTSRKESDLG